MALAENADGLNLKSQPILDHILDHLKEETYLNKPKYAEKWEKA
jgi:SOS response regulatory protein OraA/RecX